MEHDPNCPFCKLYKERRDVHFEPPGMPFWCMLDLHPMSPGHFLLIPKRHVVLIGELNADEERILFVALNQSVKFIEEEANLRGIYEAMIEEARTPNSPWFARKALAHPRFGTKPDAYNYAVNDGEAADQSVPHVHVHGIPRFAGDVEDAFGGVRAIIPGMQNYKEPR